MNLHKHLIVISILFFGAGLAVAAPLGLSWLQQRQALAAMTAEQPFVSAPQAQAASSSNPNIVQGTPRRIAVSSLGIDVAVADGFYDARTGAWTLSEDSAFYATPTTLINSDSGNTLIYGHNSQKIFGKLLQIQNGAEVVVTTDNGYQFTYTYANTEAVKPTDVHALEYSGKPRLTLQTCSGIWHETRQMFYFDLKEYRKI
jgi:LPXTG-site transpeptidase (sortase) family protein